SLHAFAGETFADMLGALSGVLDKGAAKGGDPAEAKLAPDMFPLTMQIHLACLHARNAMERLGGQKASEAEAVPASYDAMKTRVAETVAFIKAAKPADGVETQDLVIPLM